MDRIDAMKVFVSAVDEGSLVGAGRRLGRSPAAVSRAIAFLEAHVGAELLHRTTRALKLSEAGERYVAACRRVLVDLEEADIAAGGEQAAPRGILTLTAPIITGEDLVRQTRQPASRLRAQKATWSFRPAAWLMSLSLSCLSGRAEPPILTGSASAVGGLRRGS